MAVVILPIANGAYLSDSLPISAQECVNWYPNIVQAPALSQETLFGTPGTTLLATSGDVKQANRGAWVLEGVPYFVNGDALFRLESDLATLTELGEIIGTGRVWMADNGVQLMILVPGAVSTGYIFTTGPDALTTITDPDFKANGEPQTTRFIDGFFSLTTDSKKHIVSALNDGLSYNALDFGTAEADPDPLVSQAVLRNQLFLCGSITLEAEQNIGGADFPFQRTGLFIEKGVSAPFSVINASDTFMFIGGGADESPAIWALQGNSVQKVSTTAIDSILQRFTQDEISDAFAWSYAQKGAYFVGFSLPTTTLVIDTVTGRWHERKSQIADGRGVVQTVRSRINSLVSAYGLVLVGDSIDGRIGSLDPDVYTEYGANIIRPVASQPFQNNMKPFTVASIEATVESGVGDEDTPDPKMRMDISTDGGKTFKYDRTRSLGRVGEFFRRAIWRRNGRVSRFAVFRWTLSDPVKPVLIQITADIQGG